MSEEMTDDEVEDVFRAFNASAIKSARYGKWYVVRRNNHKIKLLYTQPRMINAFQRIYRAEFSSKRAAMRGLVMNDGEYKWGSG